MRKAGDYWFPAKRFGWGWGPPCAWQGWIALLLWAGLLAHWRAAALARPRFRVAVRAILTAQCWRTAPSRCITSVLIDAGATPGSASLRRS
jgi:hypothetical protein